MAEARPADADRPDHSGAGRRRTTLADGSARTTASTTSSPSGSTSTARRAARASRRARCTQFLGGQRRVRRSGDRGHGPGPAQSRPDRHARPRLATPSCPGRPAWRGSRATSRSTASRGRTARGRRCERAIERLAGIGYEMRVGVEAEHMLVTRRPDGSIAPFDPQRRRHPREALLRLQGPVGRPRLPARADRRHGTAGLGAVRVRPRGRAPRSSSSTGSTPTRSTTADRYTFFKMMTSQVAAARARSRRTCPSRSAT